MVVSLKSRHAMLWLSPLISVSISIVSWFFFSFFFHNAKELLKTVISVYSNIQILFLTHKSPGTRRESEFT